MTPQKWYQYLLGVSTGASLCGMFFAVPFYWIAVPALAVALWIDKESK